jgi:SpoVK/Ycf46/Vps4 family AAA+-type ATPase
MLCTEAALNATRRSFPQIYENDRPLVIDVAEITVTENDFIECMQSILNLIRNSTKYREKRNKYRESNT